MLIADSPEDLQVLVNRAFAISIAIGLTFNPTKSVTIHLGCNPTGRRDTVFQLDGIDIPFLTDGEPIRFLGKPFGYSLV